MELDEQVEDGSVRAELEKAFDAADAESESKQPTSSEAPTELPTEAPQEAGKESKEKPRAADGKFQKKAKETAPATQATPPAQVSSASAAPKSWKADEKGVWEKIPPEARAVIERREAEVERGFTQLDEDRNFGKTMKETIMPYMPIIQAEGGNPVSAIQSLLNTAYYLRSNASPQDKGRMIRGLAQQFNADLSENNTTTVQPNEQLNAALQKISQLEQAIQKQPEVFRQQQESTLLQREIDAFAADPKNVHYQKVKPAMAALLKGGQAADMRDAYDKACWADPDIRTSIMAEEQKAAEEKRIANIQAKTVTARKTAVSVKGSPGISPAANGSANRSLREDLEAAFDEHAA